MEENSVVLYPIILSLSEIVAVRFPNFNISKPVHSYFEGSTNSVLAVLFQKTINSKKSKIGNSWGLEMLHLATSRCHEFLPESSQTLSHCWEVGFSTLNRQTNVFKALAGKINERQASMCMNGKREIQLSFPNVTKPFWFVKLGDWKTRSRPPTAECDRKSSGLSSRIAGAKTERMG